jgi:formylglycine-generating enzyme required for sulfatase activity
LYYLLTAQVPFPCTAGLAKVSKHQFENPVSVEELRPDIPAGVAAIVGKLMAKQPEDRYQTPREVVDALMHWESQPPDTTLDGSERLTKCRLSGSTADLVAKKAPTAAGRRATPALAGALLVLLIVSFVVWLQVRPGPQPPATETVASATNRVTAVPELPVQPLRVNSIGMKLAAIPAGTFQMGSPDNEPGRRPAEGPQHAVGIRNPFFIGTHEVTVGQFKAFVAATSYPAGTEKGGHANWREPGFEQTDEHPVVYVSWHDAQAFCAWLSKKEGVQYLLPTEAQWEYCCRAGSTGRFCFGDDDRRLAEFAWYNKNSERKTHPVGQLKANAWGLHDVHGMVWEWTADWFDEAYYANSPKEDPPGPAAGLCRVARGGSFRSSVSDARSARRFWFTPTTRDCIIGFRVVRMP